MEPEVSVKGWRLATVVVGGGVVMVVVVVVVEVDRVAEHPARRRAETATITGVLLMCMKNLGKFLGAGRNGFREEARAVLAWCALGGWDEDCGVELRSGEKLLN
jgi:hypothetical protein